MIDLDAIEKAAEAATPGKYTFSVYEYGHWVKSERIHEGDSEPEIVALTGNGSLSQANAHYIATMNPSVALALVKELRALRELEAFMEMNQWEFSHNENSLTGVHIDGSCSRCDLENLLSKVKAARVEK